MTMLNIDKYCYESQGNDEAGWIIRITDNGHTEVVKQYQSYEEAVEALNPLWYLP